MAQFGREALALGPLGAADLLAQGRQIAFCGLQLGFDRAAVERIGRHRLVGQDGAALRRHLGDAADDKDALADRAALIDVDCAGPNRRDQRRMPRQHAEISFGARHDDHLDLSRQDQPLGRHQLELHQIRHCA